MPKEGYESLTIPEDLIDDIELIKKSDEVKYRSRTDVVKDSIALLKKNIIEKKNQASS